MFSSYSNYTFVDILEVIFRKGYCAFKLPLKEKGKKKGKKNNRKKEY